MKTLILIGLLITFNKKIEEAEKLLKLGKTKEAISLYKEGIKDLKGIKKIKKEIEFFDILIREENYEEALNLVIDLENKVSEFSSIYPEILYRKAFLYEKMGNLQEAQRIYEKIVLNYKKSRVYKMASDRMDNIFDLLNKDFIATLGSYSITYKEFNEFIENIPPYTRPSPSDTHAVKRILERLIYIKLLYLEALSEGLDLTEDFRKNLEKAKERILVDLYTKKINENVEVSEKEIKEYYIKNRENYKIPDRWDLRRIELKTENEAMEILKKIKRGEKFEDLARNFSLAPDASNGGLITNFTEKSSPPELLKPLKTMKEGDIKGPIRLKNGNFAIIKLEKIKKGEYRKIDEVKGQIESRLKNEKINKFWTKWKEEMYKKYDVKLYLKNE
ncbi:MAG: peptidyl-prolyl cis-trans isomerase [candidate division WOR-3 bacterium]